MMKKIIFKYYSPLLGAAVALIMSGCATTEPIGEQSQNSKTSAPKSQNFKLSSPLHAATENTSRNTIIEITGVKTSRAISDAPEMQVWLTRQENITSRRRETIPFARWDTIKSLNKNGIYELRGAGNRHGAATIELCQATEERRQCAPIISYEFKVLATADGRPDGRNFDLELKDMSNLRPLTNQQEISDATQEIQIEYKRKTEYEAARTAERTATRKYEEGVRVKAWNSASIGTTIFCQSHFLKAPGIPLDPYDPLNCSLGSSSVAELQKFGWDVTASSRQATTGITGLEGDSVSVTVKKVRSTK